MGVIVKSATKFAKERIAGFVSYGYNVFMEKFWGDTQQSLEQLASARPMLYVVTNNHRESPVGCELDDKPGSLPSAESFPHFATAMQALK